MQEWYVQLRLEKVFVGKLQEDCVNQYATGRNCQFTTAISYSNSL